MGVIPPICRSKPCLLISQQAGWAPRLGQGCPGVAGTALCHIIHPVKRWCIGRIGLAELTLSKPCPSRGACKNGAFDFDRQRAVSATGKAMRLKLCTNSR